eukprot:TRINITY_DN5644_c0_g1_i4.p1 TRINITY_DN5644_c0_g1~~TRINITY_DN5644_c0_g1_i4.p1  ORF type:complete len:610 (+),score=73.03 TRINITY_DN5644_c0_g1_i4:148-1830(+)
MATCVTDVPMYSSTHSYQPFNNTSSILCAESNSYADDESSLQSDTVGDLYGCAQSYYLEDSIYQEQQQDQLDTIAFIRNEVSKLRQQLITRKEAEFVLLQRLTYMDRQNTQLKQEIAHLRQQPNSRQDGAIVVQINVSDSVEGQEIVYDNNAEICQEGSRSFQLAAESIPCQQIQSSQTHEAVSTTNSLPDLELQVSQLMMDLEVAENAVSVAQNKENILKQHVVSMSDKIMCLNSQVEQLNTKMAVQQKESQALLQSLQLQLQQRDQQLHNISRTLSEIEECIELRELQRQSSDLADLSCALESLSASFIAPEQQQQQQQQEQKQNQGVLGVPSLVRTSNFVKQHMVGLQFMLQLNTLLYGAYLYNHTQTPNLRHHKGGKGKEVNVKKSGGVKVPLLDLGRVSGGGGVKIQSDRCQYNNNKKFSFLIESPSYSDHVKKQNSDSFLDVIINASRECSHRSNSEIVLSARLQSDCSRENQYCGLSDGNRSGGKEEDQPRSLKKKGGRFVKLVLILSSIGFALPKLIKSIRSGVGCTAPQGTHRTISFSSSQTTHQPISKSQ